MTILDGALVRPFALAIGAIGFVAFGMGCGDSGGGEGDGITPAETVEDALANLQIDTSATPRVDGDGDPLPDDYAPLGSNNPLERFAELALIGFDVNEFVVPDTQLYITKEVPDAGNNLDAELLTTVPESETPWVNTSGNHQRAAAAGDFDGDGIEELAIVYHEFNEPFIELIIIDDEADGFARSEPIVVSDLEPTDLEIVAGDFNGDGAIDAAIGVSLLNGGEVLFLEQGDDGLDTTGESMAFQAGVPNAIYHFAMAAGDLDYDLGQELAIVFNEKDTITDEAQTRYVILDDTNRGRAELSSGSVRSEVGNEVYTALVGDVSFGNLDEDPLQEVVLGGLTNMSLGTTSIKRWGYLVYALDDGKRGFAPLAGHWFEPSWQGLSESGQTLRLDYLHVNALDIDGDQLDEVHANQFVFDDFVNNEPWTEIHAIPNGEIIWESGGSIFGYENSAMAVADVNSDRREDIIYVSSARSDVRIWADDMIDGFSQIDVINSANESNRPLIVPVNVDNDSLALEYSDGSYQLVFTEPVIIAAMSAAPCNPDWGQSTDACRTSYGTAESTTTSIENSQTITASASVGYSASFSFLGVEIGSAEVIATLSAEATRTQGTAYTLTQRVEHTTGPIEDGVLFTTVPVDQYTYIIVSHPNPELVGGEVVVSLPRDPITALTTRDFYNRSITPDSFHVDERIFNHLPGDPTTYPSRGQKNAALSQFDGIESLEVDVGEGGGTVTVGVSVFEEVTMGASYNWNASLDIKTTAGGFVTGASVGYGEGQTISLGAGMETSYTGTVSNLDATNFTSNGYSFGLYSYVYSDPSGQQFEVLDYWVNQVANNAP